MLIDTIIANDEKNNQFIKKVKLLKYDDKYVIDFGNWASYYFESVSTDERIINASDKELFMLDFMGRNHKGSPVSITIKQLKDVLAKAQSLIDKDN